MSQEAPYPYRPRGPVTPRTEGGRVTLAPSVAAKRLGLSNSHFGRLLRNGKLKLTKHYLYEGARPRLFEDEVEAVKQEGVE
jgi:hypothetical protein